MTEEQKLSLEQENAVEMCCDVGNVIASVTGGAGVGKTLVMGRVYKEFRRMRKSVALCAPTGRAAKRDEN
jgi:exodeoxyribonuclease V alpha subunit